MCSTVEFCSLDSKSRAMFAARIANFEGALVTYNFPRIRLSEKQKAEPAKIAKSNDSLTLFNYQIGAQMLYWNSAQMKHGDKPCAKFRTATCSS